MQADQGAANVVLRLAFEQFGGVDQPAFGIETGAGAAAAEQQAVQFGRRDVVAAGSQQGGEALGTGNSEWSWAARAPDGAMSRMKALYPTSTTPVGASLLAMVANDNAGNLTTRGVLGFLASKLVSYSPTPIRQ